MLAGTGCDHAAAIGHYARARAIVEALRHYPCDAHLLGGDFNAPADGPELAVQAGVTAIVQPGGSIRDDEVIAAADERGIAMVFTGTRHFRH